MIVCCQASITEIWKVLPEIVITMCYVKCEVNMLDKPREFNYHVLIVNRFPSLAI